MNVLHVDIYVVGVELNGVGNRYYLIVACGITMFSVAEPTVEQNAKTSATALMKIWLRFDLSHSSVEGQRKATKKVLLSM